MRTSEIWWRDATLAACLMTAALTALAGPAGALAQAPTACQTVPLQADGRYDFESRFLPAPGVYGASMWQARDLCYADGTRWVERKYGETYDVTLDQRFELYRSRSLPKRQALPLILWSHPSGPSQVMIRADAPADATAPFMDKLVVPAIQSGFAFMSIQFRHPRASQSVHPEAFDPQVPHTDIAQAVQWVRSRAADLGVDPDNIFLVGQSRGSLALLDAFMPDLKDSSRPDWHAESSRPRAVFAVQAQTTYEHVELRNLFIRPQASVPIPPLTQPGFDYHAYLDRNDLPFIRPGSALAALDLNVPPFWLRYERAPTDHSNITVVPMGSRVAAEGQDPMKEGTCYEPRAKDYPALEDSGCFDEHHPNFGAALAARFLSLQPSPAQRDAVGIQYGPRQARQKQLDEVSSHFYDGYACFFIQNLTPGGRLLRSMAAPDSPACRITDMPWPPKP